jgi:plastocyanin
VFFLFFLLIQLSDILFHQNASAGDTVIFHFKQKNHTATQSTLANPCSKLEGGFDSGLYVEFRFSMIVTYLYKRLRSSIPVPDSNMAGPFPVAQYNVTDSSPVWVYCRQEGHCVAGMVFAINPGSDFSKFQAAAMGGALSPSAAAGGVQTVTATITGADGSVVTTTYGSYPGAAAPTTVAPTDHKVTVGGPGKLVYDPSEVKAQPGDTVTFEFRQKNHTATQSTFANPCRALTLTSTTGQVGFDSGL